MRSWELKGQVAGGITQHVLKEVKKALLVICTRVTSECTRFQPIRMRNFLIDVILKVSKFTVMIRTDAFCFGNFLQI